MLNFIAKLMLLTVYLWSALLNKTINFKKVRGKAIEAGLPFAGAALVGASILELAASFVILFPSLSGGRPVYVAAAVAMAIYTLVAAIFFHPFWKQTGALRAGNQINFLKNIGLAGAFLLLIAG